MGVICVLGALVLATHRRSINFKCTKGKYTLFSAHKEIGARRFEATLLPVPRIGTRRDGTTLLLNWTWGALDWRKPNLLSQRLLSTFSIRQCTVRSLYINLALKHGRISVNSCAENFFNWYTKKGQFFRLHLFWWEDEQWVIKPPKMTANMPHR